MDSLVLDEVVHLVADLLHSLLRDLVPKDEALILRQRIHEVRGPRGAPCRGRRHIGHAVLNRPLAKLGGGTRLGGDCGRGLSALCHWPQQRHQLFLTIRDATVEQLSPLVGGLRLLALRARPPDVDTPLHDRAFVWGGPPGDDGHRVPAGDHQDRVLRGGPGKQLEAAVDLELGCGVPHVRGMHRVRPISRSWVGRCPRDVRLMVVVEPDRDRATAVICERERSLREDGVVVTISPEFEPSLELELEPLLLLL